MKRLNLAINKDQSPVINIRKTSIDHSALRMVVRPWSSNETSTWNLFQEDLSSELFQKCQGTKVFHISNQLIEHKLLISMNKEGAFSLAITSRESDLTLRMLATPSSKLKMC